MKKLTWHFAVGLVLTFTASAGKAADPVEPSVISNYVGAYRGSVNVVGSVIPGTRASFTGSRSKEIGTLRLTTYPSGSAVPFAETVSFRGNRVTYSIQPGTSEVAQGRGSARISRNVIRYSAPFTASGNSFVLQGTIRRSSRRLSVSHTLAGPTVVSLNYALSRIGN